MTEKKQTVSFRPRPSVHDKLKLCSFIIQAIFYKTCVVKLSIIYNLFNVGMDFKKKEHTLKDFSVSHLVGTFNKIFFLIFKFFYDTVP